MVSNEHARCPGAPPSQLSLSPADFGHVGFYIDLLAERGPLLDEPYSRQLGGKLRELRFYMGQDRQRISYYLTGDQRAILLTVFRKQRARERAEVERAERAMVRCLQEAHTAKDGSDEYETNME